MASQEILDLIYLGTELRSLEYKQSMNWDQNNTKTKVIKSILAMSNIKDGGYLVLGVGEDNGKWVPNGMSQEDYNSFTYDDVAGEVSRCADPFVEFGIEKVLDDDKRFIVFSISEFHEIPVICKGGGPGNVLSVGLPYIRTRRIQESAPVSSAEEMREIVSLSIDKGLEQFKTRAAKAGIISLRESTSDDSEIFEAQVRDILP